MAKKQVIRLSVYEKDVISELAKKPRTIRYMYVHVFGSPPIEYLISATIDDLKKKGLIKRINKPADNWFNDKYDLTVKGKLVYIDKIVRK